MFKKCTRVSCLYGFLVVLIVCSLTYAIILLHSQQKALAVMGTSIDRIMVNVNLLEEERMNDAAKRQALDVLEADTIEEYQEIGQ